MGLFLRSTPADKNMLKVNKKGMFQERYSGAFMISLENIFEVCDEDQFSQIFRSLYKQQ